MGGVDVLHPRTLRAGFTSRSDCFPSFFRYTKYNMFAMTIVSLEHLQLSYLLQWQIPQQLRFNGGNQ
jgi:hypothetical protein